MHCVCALACKSVPNLTQQIEHTKYIHDLFLAFMLRCGSHGALDHIKIPKVINYCSPQIFEPYTGSTNGVAMDLNYFASRRKAIKADIYYKI